MPELKDRKAAAAKRAVKESLSENRPVVIFCKYNAQAKKYAEMFAQYNPAIYTGMTSDEGVKRNERRKPIRYRKNEEGGWEFDEKGYPIEDPKGQPMLALDYERLTFQHAADRKVIIATYSAGAVGTTFTKGKTVIEDDLAEDCIEEIQMEDRTHRIDHEHQTHHTVKYYKMISRYPKKFLAEMERRWVRRTPNGWYEEVFDRETAEEEGLSTAFETFFEQGTYDEVKIKNLQVQRHMFHLVNDGIADDNILNEGQLPFQGID